MRIIHLTIVFLQIGLLSFGGGMSVLSMISEQVVGRLGWISPGTLSDLVVLSEMTPGPIAVNAATFIGARLLGIGGAIAATIGCVFPGCTMALTLSALYQRHQNLPAVKSMMLWVRPAVVAVIATGGLTIFRASVIPHNALDYISLAGFIVSFWCFYKKDIKPLCMLLIIGTAGMALRLLYPFV
ncbi:MAG: chromate transporter [Candidatus Fimivivens sp.]|nr:chromate transporter [Candidatus Fimivivens sp.]